MPRFVRAVWDTNINSGPGRRSRLETYYCVSCGSEYQIDTTNCGTEGVALIITKWVALGPGLDPADIRWTRHMQLTFQKHEITISKTDIHSQFEQDAMFPLNDLTQRNRSLLEGRAYKRKADYWYSGCWILQANTRLPWFYPRPEKRACCCCCSCKV